VLGDSNIIFFINVLQEVIENTNNRVALFQAFVHHVPSSLLLNTDLIFVEEISTFIPTLIRKPETAHTPYDSNRVL
jgi:hypothetical protein